MMVPPPASSVAGKVASCGNNSQEGARELSLPNMHNTKIGSVVSLVASPAQAHVQGTLIRDTTMVQAGLACTFE